MGGGHATVAKGCRFGEVTRNPGWALIHVFSYPSKEQSGDAKEEKT